MTAAMNLVMKASEPTDTELVRRLVDGDKEAFAELYQRRHANIYRFALHMSGRPEMADDVAQETFMGLINKTAVYDETKGAVNSFLLGIRPESGAAAIASGSGRQYRLKIIMKKLTPRPQCTVTFHLSREKRKSTRSEKPYSACRSTIEKS
jgi:RNA polymerase sigma-70 factor (ECF subfamily)